MEKTVLNKSNEWKEDLDNENKNQSAQADKTQDHTSEDMDFEVVSFSSSEGEIVKRSRSYEEAINLENSSDFCNGQLSNIITELNSSSLDSELQQHGENPGIQEMMDSMEIVEHPSGGSVEPFLPEEGENGNRKNEKQAKSQALNIPKDFTGKGDVISGTSEVNVSQVNMNESGDAPSGTRSSKSLSTKDVEKTPDTPGQNKGKEGEIQDTSSRNEIQDSGTLSTENTVYKPSWSKNSEQEQQVNEDSIKLDERKRKSPEKENVDQSKKQHLSEDPSKGGDTKGKNRVKFTAEVKDKDSVAEDKSKEGEVLDGQGQDEEEGEEDEEEGEGGEEEQGENDGEQEEDSSSESDEGKTTENEPKDGVKKKKRKRKKKKLKYQIKKNQIPMKSTDNKTPVSKNADNDDEEDFKDKKEHEKEKKSEQNRKLRSQTSKENDAANVGSTKPEEHIGTNNYESGQPSSKENSQPTEKSKPGRIVIPVHFEEGKNTVSLKPTCKCACRLVCMIQNWFPRKSDNAGMLRLPD